MLKNLQIKIIIVFLILGIIIIGAMGYINFFNLQVITQSIQAGNYDTIIAYQGSLKVITLMAILVFTCVCVLIRNICN